MNGITRFGLFLFTLTSIFLVIYRIMYYYQVYTKLPATLGFYHFLGGFVLVFGMIMAIGVVMILSGFLRNIYLEIIVFFLVWVLISIYTTGFVGVP